MKPKYLPTRIACKANNASKATNMIQKKVMKLLQMNFVLVHLVVYQSLGLGEQTNEPICEAATSDLANVTVGLIWYS